MWRCTILEKASVHEPQWRLELWPHEGNVTLTIACVQTQSHMSSGCEPLSGMNLELGLCCVNWAQGSKGHWQAVKFNGTIRGLSIPGSSAYTALASSFVLMGSDLVYVCVCVSNSFTSVGQYYQSEPCHFHTLYSRPLRGLAPEQGAFLSGDFTRKCVIHFIRVWLSALKPAQQCGGEKAT